jgi:hypothetical protein
MSILASLEAVPNRIRALARLIAFYGPLERQEAKARMVFGEGGQFSSVVRETVKLGLVEEQEKLQLAPGLEPAQVNDDTWFMNFVHRQFCADGLVPDSHNYHVAFALAWLLTRKPSSNLKWNGEHNLAIREDLNGDDTYDVTNASRGAMLGYWAKFLGYASSSSDGSVRLIIPDPTNAIACRLDQIFGQAKELAIKPFLKELGKLCPVLDGGVIREQVERRLKKARREETLSPATSLALLRLENRGVITLAAPSDANVVLLDLLQNATRRVSHVGQGKQS